MLYTILVLKFMYGSESWLWQKKHTSRVNAVEMPALRSTYDWCKIE
jgi:hypothetical protein